MNREEWLEAATELVAPLFDGLVDRKPARVSVGFPAGGRGSNRTTIGQCHYASEDKIPQIFIHPRLTDPVEVLGVLVHELTHAYLGGAAGHGKEFGRVARGIGLEGKLTATTVGAELETDLRQVIEVLGEYPHSSLDASNRKKQTTRMIKVECECGIIYRMSRGAMENALEIGCADRECDGEVQVG